MSKIIISVPGVTLWELTSTGVNGLAQLRLYPSSPSGSWTDRAIAHVFGQGATMDGWFYIYAWNPDDTSADDGYAVIKPDAITNAGRWNLVIGTLNGQPQVPPSSWPVLLWDAGEYTVTGVKVDFATALGIATTKNVNQIILTAPLTNTDDIVFGTQEGPEVPLRIQAGTSYKLSAEGSYLFPLDNYGIYAASTPGDVISINFLAAP